MNNNRNLLCPDLTPIKIEHQNPWFSVLNRGGYFTTEPNENQVAILPIIDDAKILLVKVKRPVINDVTWELPAGGAEKGESFHQTAAREFKEETGLKVDAERFHKLKPLCVCPNRYPKHPNLFQIDITLKEFKERKKHDSEIHEVKAFTFRAIQRMIINGEIYVTLPTAIISRFLLTKIFDRENYE